MQSPVLKKGAEPQSPSTCPYSVTVRRNPHRTARPTPKRTAALLPFHSQNTDPISKFPTQDDLTSTKETPPSSESQLSEDLKVFLRIRPLKSKSASLKTVSGFSSKKKASPKPRGNKLNKSISCIVVNDPRSVTVSPPTALQDARRTKTESYQGFSQVFAPETSQGQVYELMMKPLVEDFIKGKNGMLVALGPSGSGKTHTVFGCPRDPGMVPLALRHMFQPTGEVHSTLSRSFYITIFEISSERGKGEKILDLLSDGTDISIYQSTIKGLHEMVISNVAQAESVIASAMLKRSTAMTKANSQSSRSQCVINIRLDTQNFEGQSGVLSDSAVLTIIDLAGAEREKNTGLQGKRLGESSFINNTSMVFGLCLRSLFEHQKNPKKPLQKHFQSSLLTRYLREHLEGKKRMSLILTVKSEEEDYTDTSFVLRQASPYMQIKFTGNTQPDLLGAKRHSQALARSDQAKRLKVGHFTGPKADRKGFETETGHQLDEEAIFKENIEESLPQNAQVPALDVKEKEKEKEKDDDAPCNINELQRSTQIMQNFAKAIWNVLKEYKSKLKEADNEIDNLRGNMDFEKARRLEMEKEILYLKTNCSCSKKISASDLVEVDTYLEFSAERSQKKVDITCIAEETNPTDNLICHTSQFIDSESEFDSYAEQNLETCLQSDCNARIIISQTVGDSRMNASLPESSAGFDNYSSCLRDSARDDEQVPQGVTSADYPGSNTIKKDKTMEPTSVVTDRSCYFPGASHDKHGLVEQKEIDCLIKVVESGSIQNDQVPQGVTSADHPGSKTIKKDKTMPTSVVTDRSCYFPGASRDKYGLVEQKEIDSSIKLVESGSIQNDQVPQGVTSAEHPRSNTIKKDKTMEPTSVVTDRSCYFPGASHDKHGLVKQKEIDSSIKLVESGSIQNDQEPFASIADEFCILLRSSQKEHEQKTESSRDSMLNGKNVDHSSEVPKLAVSLLSSINIKGDCPESEAGKPKLHNVETEEIISKAHTKQKDEKSCDANGLMGYIIQKDTKPCPPHMNNSKPKRRIMPASTVLLRDMRLLDLEDESDSRSKGSRGRKKTDAEENQRTQGSINLLRLLKSNLHR